MHETKEYLHLGHVVRREVEEVLPREEAVVATVGNAACAPLPLCAGGSRGPVESEHLEAGRVVELVLLAETEVDNVLYVRHGYRALCDVRCEYDLPPAGRHTQEDASLLLERYARVQGQHLQATVAGGGTVRLQHRAELRYLQQPRQEDEHRPALVCRRPFSGERHKHGFIVSYRKLIYTYYKEPIIYYFLGFNTRILYTVLEPILYSIYQTFQIAQYCAPIKSGRIQYKYFYIHVIETV